jgi:hypothetical protein
LRFSTLGFFSRISFSLAPEHLTGVISNFTIIRGDIHKFVLITSVNDTVDKLFTGVRDTGDNSMTSGINLSPVTTTPAIIKRRVNNDTSDNWSPAPFKTAWRWGLKNHRGCWGWFFYISVWLLELAINKTELNLVVTECLGWPMTENNSTSLWLLAGRKEEAWRDSLKWNASRELHCKKAQIKK